MKITKKELVKLIKEQIDNKISIQLGVDVYGDALSQFLLYCKKNQISFKKIGVHSYPLNQIYGGSFDLYTFQGKKNDLHTMYFKFIQDKKATKKKFLIDLGMKAYSKIKTEDE